MVNSGIHQGQKPGSLDSEGTQPYEKRYRWVMLALAWLLYGSYGLIAFSLPPLVTPILEELNISHSRMGLILGAWPLTYIIVAAIGGAIIDKWGIRKSLFVGIIIIGLSESLRYFTNGFAFLFLCVALFGIGGPMISIGCPKTISLWFRGRERGMAVGIYSMGTWIGGIVALSTINSIFMPLTGYSWRLTFVGFSLLAFVTALLWWFLAKDIKPAESTEGDSMTKVFTTLSRVRNIQLILIIGFLSMVIGHGVTDWLPKILEAGGLSAATAGFAAAIPILGGIPAVLTVPRMVAPHLRGRIVALSSLLAAIAVLMITAMSGVNLIMGLLFYGLASYILTPLLMLILMELPEVGSRYMGAAAGMYFCIAEIGGFAGPIIVGAFKDLSGGFLLGIGFLAGLSIIRLVMALGIRIKPVYDTKAS